MIGTEVTSAFWKSSSNDSLSALPALASPNSSTRKSGWASPSAATVASGASTRSSAVTSASSPGSGISNVISADVPSCEIPPSVPAE